MVYGWTRKDFVRAMDFRVKHHQESTPILPPQKRRKIIFRRNSQEQLQRSNYPSQHQEQFLGREEDSCDERDTRDLLNSPKNLIDDEMS